MARLPGRDQGQATRAASVQAPVIAHRGSPLVHRYVPRMPRTTRHQGAVPALRSGALGGLWWEDHVGPAGRLVDLPAGSVVAALRDTLLASGLDVNSPQIPVGVVVAQAASAPPAPLSDYSLPFPTSAGMAPSSWTSWPAPTLAWAESAWQRRPLISSGWRAVFKDDPDSAFLLSLEANGLRTLGGYSGPAVDPAAAAAAEASRAAPESTTLASGIHLACFKARFGLHSPEERAAITAILLDGLQAGTLVRPPFGHSSRHIHRVSAVPKGDNGHRVIHNLSYPYDGRAINDQQSYVKFKYATSDDAVEQTRLKGRGCFYARVDASAYYEQFSVDPADWHLAAFVWDFGDGQGPVELWPTRLMFGLRNAPEVAHRVTMAIVRAMQRRGFSIIAIMDDFLIVEETEAECRAAYSALLGLLAEIGITVNTKPHKTHGPRQSVTFVGVLFDSVSFTASLDAAKLAKAVALLHAFEGRRRASVKEVQSLLGYLNWICRVVYGGRTFLHRMLLALRGATSALQVNLDSGFHDDVSWWLKWLPSFNGKRVIIDPQAWPRASFFTDADLNTGIGIFFQGRYAGHTFADCAARFPAHAVMRPGEADPIHLKELYAVVIAIEFFGTSMRDTHVLLRTDNSVVEAAINRGACDVADPRMMGFIRTIFWMSVRLNFRLVASYVSTFDNGLADALSRQQWDRFHTLRVAAGWS